MSLRVGDRAGDDDFSRSHDEVLFSDVAGSLSLVRQEGHEAAVAPFMPLHRGVGREPSAPVGFDTLRHGTGPVDPALHGGEAPMIASSGSIARS